MLTNLVNRVYLRGMQPPPGPLVRAVRRLTGRPDARLAAWEASPAVHRLENMTTRSLDRCTGALDDGTRWSIVAKTLHPASCSPGWSQIPPQFHSEVLEDLDWMDEPRLFRCGLADALPEGLRFPRLWGVDEAPDRITLWMEDVPDTTPWDLDRYRRTARALGRLHGRWPEEPATAELGLRRRDLRRLFAGKIHNFDLAIQADDSFWRQPAVAGAVDDRYRADLARLADVVPALLSRAESLPHGAAHGDATPDNFREPGDGTVVAIDWSYGSVAPVGADLAQLFVGRFESGAQDPGTAPDVLTAVIEGYLAGAADEGAAAERPDVERSLVTHLAVRSLFSLLIVDHRHDLPLREREALLARRAQLGRFGIDLALARDPGR